MKNKTLVFGASLKTDRYSNRAVRLLRANNIKTMAFGMQEGEISGVQVTTNLDDLQNIDTISLYMNPQRQREFYDTIIGLKPNRVIFNPGTENPELQKRLQEEGIAYENACTLTLLATGQYA